MPSRNIIKTYIPNSFYHIYNRGVEKRVIFEDDQDHKVFLKYLKEYLSPPPDKTSLKKAFTLPLQGGSFKGVPRQPKNYYGEIELVAYCLMPNHFHLLLKQKSDSSMEGFMRSLATRYSMYFNKRYDRVGKLFQGHYKAVFINDDNYLLHLSRYIHLNPKEINSDLLNAYSSYAEYLGKRNTTWLKPSFILDYFNNSVTKDIKKFNSYNHFVENYSKDAPNSETFMGKLLIDNL